MYLRSLQIDNLKLLRGFELDVCRDGEPRMWTVLVGRNGLCKTSILRAVALAASGPARANQLAQDLMVSLRDARRTDASLEIQAEFELPATPDYGQLARGQPALTRSLRSSLQLAANRQLFSGDSSFLAGAAAQSSTQQVLLNTASDASDARDPLEDARTRKPPPRRWFVAAYGTSRSLALPGSTAAPDDVVRTRMETLFDRGRIIGTSFADHFDGAHARTYVKVLRAAMLNHAELLPNVQTLELRGRGGVNSADQLVMSHRFDTAAGTGSLRLPATWLSHGYQATIAWLADLVGHILWEASESNSSIDIDPADMQGLVLIDELDLHLHPSWQVGLIPALKQTFPKLQFIVTTHSPMLLAGLEGDEIVMLDQDPSTGDITKRSDPRPAKLMTGTELLKRYFEIDRLYPVNLSKEMFQYGRLASDPERTDAEEVEVQRIYRELQQAGVAPDWAPIPRRVG